MPMKHFIELAVIIDFHNQLSHKELNSEPFNSKLDVLATRAMEPITSFFLRTIISWDTIFTLAKAFQFSPVCDIAHYQG